MGPDHHLHVGCDVLLVALPTSSSLELPSFCEHVLSDRLDATQNEPARSENLHDMARKIE